MPQSHNISIQDIKDMMGGRLVADEHVKNYIAKAILKLPNEIGLKIIKECWFFSSDKDSFGYAFNGNDLKDMHLIFLSDVLFDESEHQIMYTILHEIGHIALNHKNSIQYTQSKEEIRSQEKAADEFAKQYLD